MMRLLSNATSGRLASALAAVPWISMVSGAVCTGRPPATSWTTMSSRTAPEASLTLTVPPAGRFFAPPRVPGGVVRREAGPARAAGVVDLEDAVRADGAAGRGGLPR